MPVTEFAILEALEPHAVDSPLVQTFLADVARQQAAWSGYPLLFFKDAAKPTAIYLISGWTDVPAHDKWIASEPNQELLGRAGPILAVKQFFHLNIDFEMIPVEVQRMVWEIVSNEGVGVERNDEVAGSGGSGSGSVWEGVGRVLEEKSGDIHRLSGYMRIEEEGVPQITRGQYREGPVSTAAGSRAEEDGVTAKAVLLRMYLRDSV